MDLEIFTFLFSENEEQRNMATSTILEAMRQPEFLNFLIQSLASIIEESSVTENILLVQAICIVLHKQVNNKKKDKSFFKEDQIEFAYKALFQILFNIPFTIRRYIIDILSSFFTFFKEIDYREIIAQCLNIIEQNENIGDTTTALNLINLWTGQQNKYVPNEEKENRELCIQNAYPIVSLLVKQSLEFYDSLPPELLQQIQVLQANQFSGEYDENELKNMKEYLSLIEFNGNFLEQSSMFVLESITMSTFIAMADFKEIINSFTFLLHLDIEVSSSLIDAKISIVELFRSINFCFKPSAIREKLKQYYISFSDEMGESIINSILDCALICRNYKLFCTILQTLMIYIYANLFQDIILVDDFIIQILIPASFLNDEDLQTFVEIPEQYIGICLLLDDKDANHMDTIRQCIAKIIEKLPEPFIPYLLSFLDLPSSNAIEAEAKVFLKKVIYLYFSKESNLISQAEQVILEFHENGMQMEDYYYASLLSLLSTMDQDDSWFNYKEEKEDIKNTNLKDSIEIAIFSLLNSNSIVIQIAAIDLLYDLIDEDFITIVRKDPDSILNSFIPLDDIFESILNLAATVQYPKVGGILEKLVLSFPDTFLDSSLQIIDNFFHLWYSLQYDDDSYLDKSSSILVFISRIIMEMPQNCETLYQLSIEMTPEILEALQNDTSYCSGFKQLIDILGCLSYKIDEPPNEFFNMILSFVLEVGFNPSNSKATVNEEEEEENDEDINNEDEISVYNGVTLYMRDFSVVICSLICRNNFFAVSDAVDYVVNIIENLFVYDDETTLFASGLIITSCLIQSAAVTASALEESNEPSFDPSQFISLASKAANFIHDFNTNNFGLDENEEEEEEEAAIKSYDDDEVYDKIKNKELFVLAIIVISSSLIANEEVAMEMLDEKIVHNWIFYHKLCYDVAEKLQFIHWSTIALLILSKYDWGQIGGLLFKIAVEQFMNIKIKEENDDDVYENEDENDDLIKFNISEFPFNDLLSDKEFSQIDPDDQRFQFLSKQLLDRFLTYIS